MQFNLVADTTALCRVCMTDKQGHRTDLYDASSLVAGQPSLHGMLQAVCASVFERSDAEQTPGMPTKVCAICRNAILAAFKLHQTCVETDRRLGELLALKWELQDRGGDEEPGDPLRSSNKKDGILNEIATLEGESEPEQDSGTNGIEPENDHDSQERKPWAEPKGDSCSDNENDRTIKVEALDLTDASDNEGQDCDSIAKDGDKNLRTCEICFEEFTEASMLRNHMADRHQLYMCEICHATFGSQFWFSKHKSLHIMSKTCGNTYPNPVSCSECGKTLANTARLRLHLRRKCVKLIYLSLTNREIAARTCNLCGKFHQSVRHLFKHVKREHGKHYKCGTCDEYFPTKAALTKHQQVHKSPLTCSICRKSFLTKAALEDHVVSHTAKSFACNLCPLRFFTKAELDGHVLSHKQISICGRKFHTCQTCEEGFPTKKELIKHRKVHQESTNCSICGKTLVSKAALKTHMLRHSDTKPHPCENCPMRFYTKQELIFHMFSHVTIRNNICDICGAKFKKKNSLKRHVKLVHEGSRPYECQICGFKLVSTTQLKRHLLGHTGEKPFQCELCSKAFAKLDELANHVARKHRGGKAYPCDRCDESFRLLSELRQHYRVHVQAGEQIEEMQFTTMAILQRVFAKDKQKLVERGNDSN